MGAPKTLPAGFFGDEAPESLPADFEFKTPLPGESVIGRIEHEKALRRGMGRYQGLVDVGKLAANIAPTVGATAGAFTPHPIFGAAVGGALGQLGTEALEQSIYGEREGGALRVLGEGATQGAIEGVTRGLGAAVKGGYKLFRNVIPAREGAELVAREIAPVASAPRNVGQSIRNLFSRELETATTAKNALVKQLNLPTAHVTYDKAIPVLEAEVTRLRGLRKSNPALFADIEGRAGLTNTLNVLENELRSLQEAKVLPGNLAQADARRSMFFTFKEQLDPGVSQRMASKFNQAITDDVTAAIEKSSGKDAAAQYLARSNRVRQVLNLTDTGTMKRVFGEGGVDAARIFKVADPEELLASVRVLKGDPAMIQQVRRSFFEQLFTTNKIPSQSRAVLQELFGADAAKVEKFGTLLTSDKSQSFLRQFGTLPIPSGKGARFGLTMPQAERGVLSKSDVADLLSDPETRRVLLATLEPLQGVTGKAITSRNVGTFFRVAKALISPELPETQERVKSEVEQFRSLGRP